MAITDRSLAITGKAFCYGAATFALTGHDLSILCGRGKDKTKVMHEIREHARNLAYVMDVGISMGYAGGRAVGEGVAPNQVIIRSPKRSDLEKLRVCLSKPCGYVAT